MGFNYDTWGGSWGAAWGGSWGTGSVVVTPPAEPEVGGRIVGGTFSRKRWRELLEAWQAQERLEQHAMEAAADAKKEADKRKVDALQKAAKISELALASANAHADMQVTALVNALNAVAAATRVAEQIKHANRVARISRIMIEEAEDEEFALTLILSS